MNFRFQPLISSPWLIFGVALLLRLAFLFSRAHQVPDAALAVVPFQNEVGSVAAALAHGQGFCCVFRQPTGPTAWLAPVYPFFLASIFRVFGSFTVASFYVAALFNCVLSALACLPLFYVGLRIGNRATAAAAGWLWAIFPSGILIPFEWIWDTSLSALLAISLLWATFRLTDDPRRRNFILYGLFWGFCLLVNPALGAVFPFMLVWIYFRVSSSRLRRLGYIVLVVCLAILVCLPWTVRNAVQFRRFIPIRSDFPFELWMGNNPIYDEHSRQTNRITRYEEAHRYSQLGETAFLEEKGRAAKEFVRAHPTLALQLAARRAVAMWMGTSTPWQDFWRTDSNLVRFVLFWNAVTILGVATGLACLFFVRRWFLLPLAAFPLAFPLVYYLTQVSLRLRHPCDPILALLMALGVTWLWLRAPSHANAR
ncbi:MAG TPA: glycosyltransferase family 39 protein [Candidatus Acidoferrales bacterium]|nr:glycosyltransferase family 39 protein [Candidatus Acidoferrales bacterium]